MKLVQELKAVVAMVLVQISYAVMNVLYKLAADDDMNLTILVAYRLLFATAFMVPLALIFERKNKPKLTRNVLFLTFLSGLIGASLAQNLFIQSLALTSAIFASAIPNLMPGFTFVMAICFSLEKLELGTKAGNAKVAGTVLGICGAMVFTLYKGVEIKIWPPVTDLLHHHHRDGGETAPSDGLSVKFILGSLLALGSSLCYALWLIIQAKISKRYPAPYSSTALMCIMGSVQTMVFALCMERDLAHWKLGWNIRLLTAAYTGIVTSGVIVVLMSWCIHLKGPLFASVFTPLSLVIVAIVGSLALEEKLHLGSILGSVFIVAGLYVVLWGKSKETKKPPEQQPPTESQEPELEELVVAGDNKTKNEEANQVTRGAHNK